MLKFKERRILGVDPGTNLLGYALISIKNNSLYIMEMGVLKLAHLNTHPEKLAKIYKKVDQLVQSYAPEELAIEAPFFGKNVQSMLKLGRAQGVTIAAAVKNDLIVTEYAPKKIKQSITGNGNASKEQVAAMLATIFGRQIKTETTDITDALAVAVCHYFQRKNPSKSSPTGKKSVSDWSQFVKQNRNRVK